MSKQIKRISIFVLTFVLLASFFCITSFANIEVRMKVYFPYDVGKGYFSHNGTTYSGYYYEYFNEISRYTNWEYDFHICKDKEEQDELLNSGDYDLFVGLTGEKKSNRFAYSDMSIGEKKYSLTVKKNNPNVSLENYQSILGLDVVVSDDQKELEETFKNQLKTNNIYYVEDKEEVYPNAINIIHKSREEKSNGFKQDDYDSILSDNEYAFENQYYSAITFFTEPLYVVSPVMYGSNVNAFDTAVKKIISTNTSYNENLFNRIFKSIYKNDLAFSATENVFMSEKHIYNVAVIDNYIPYCYQFDDKYKGIIPSNLEKISNMLDRKIEFNLIPYNSSDEAFRAVEKGYCDVIAIPSLSERLSYKKNIITNISKRYYSDKIVVYKNINYKGKISDAKVIVLKDMVEKSYTQFGISKNQIIRTDKLTECFNLINNKADLTVAFESAGKYLVLKNNYENVDVDPIASVDYSAALGYSNAVNSIAIEIIDKCINQIDTSSGLSSSIIEAVSDINNENLIVDYNQLVVFFVILIATTFLFVIAVILYNKKLSNKRQNNIKLFEKVSERVADNIEDISGLNSIITDYINDSNGVKNENITKALKKIKYKTKQSIELIGRFEELIGINTSNAEKEQIFDLCALVGKLDTEFGIEARRNKVDLITKIDYDVVNRVIGKERVIEEILRALLSNAIAYNKPNGTVLFNVSNSKSRVNNKEGYALLNFSIEDSGQGIVPENIPKLFKPFEREKRTSGLNSMGIGLFLASRYAKMLNTDIKVISTYKEGSTFSFEVKIKLADENNKTTKNNVSELNIFDLKDKNYLLIDTNEHYINIIRLLIKSVSGNVEVKSSLYDYSIEIINNKITEYDGIIINYNSFTDVSCDEIKNLEKTLKNLNIKPNIVVLATGFNKNQFGENSEIKTLNMPLDNTALIKYLFDASEE